MCYKAGALKQGEGVGGSFVTREDAVITNSKPELTAAESIFRLTESELWVVTAHDAARGGGLIATWVSPASIDPQTPTVSTAIAANHYTRELIDTAKSFALHLLRPRQIDLVWRFALASGRETDKLAGLNWKPGKQGSPILDDCLAWLDCKVYERHDGGDRIYYWADVIQCERNESAIAAGEKPLTDKQMIDLATDEQKAALRSGMLADAEIQRPLLAEHKAKLAKGDE